MARENSNDAIKRARTVALEDALHERKMLRRAVEPRLKNLQEACRQLEHLAQYNPDERDREFILSRARALMRHMEEVYANVAATQIDMGLFK